jgi:hypothetical protein
MKENGLNSVENGLLSTLPPPWESPSTRLAILPRQPEPGWQEYFQALMPTPSHLAATIATDRAADTIQQHLWKQLPRTMQQHPFTRLWVEDMAAVCQQFAAFINQPTLCFWLRTTRVCSKFHVDKTPYRLLLTYFGPGTEWIPTPYAERHHPDAIQRIAPWHLAILQGGLDGIVHRSPPQTASSYSVLMRLDHPDFLSR